MRILHLRDTSWLCGPGKTILETVRQNPDPDFSYEVAAFGSLRSNDFLLRMADECPVLTLPRARGRIPEAALRLARYVRQRGFDIVHSHDFKSRLLSVLIRPTASAALVTTAHGHVETDRKSHLRNRADIRMMGMMDEVFVVSRAAERELEGMEIPRSRLVLVRNCIVSEHYRPGPPIGRLRRELGLDPGTRLIGCVGRLSREKGQDILVDVMRELARRETRYHLVLAGDGPDREFLQYKVRRAGLEYCVTLVGHRTDIIDVYRDLDLLVLCSRSEGMPNALLEAMALQVPVAATAVGGVPELIEDSNTGVLLSPDGVPRMADQIVQILDNPREAKRRAIEARALIEREFEMGGLIAKTHEAYRALIGPRGQ